MTRRKTGEQTHALSQKFETDQDIGDRILVAETGQCKGNQVHGSPKEIYRHRPAAATALEDTCSPCCVAVRCAGQDLWPASGQGGPREAKISVDPSSIRISRTGAGISPDTRSENHHIYVNHIAATVNPRQPRNTPCSGHEATARRRWTAHGRPLQLVARLVPPTLLVLARCAALHRQPVLAIAVAIRSWRSQTGSKRPINVRHNVDQIDVHKGPQGMPPPLNAIALAPRERWPSFRSCPRLCGFTKLVYTKTHQPERGSGSNDFS